MDIQPILEEYKKQEIAGLKKVESGELTHEVLHVNLFNGVCTEMLRLWMGGKSGRLRDATTIKEIKIMLEGLDWDWKEICLEIDIGEENYFRDFLQKFNERLYRIWMS